MIYTRHGLPEDWHEGAGVKSKSMRLITALMVTGNWENWAGRTWNCSLCGAKRIPLNLVEKNLNAVHFFTSRLGLFALPLHSTAACSGQLYRLTVARATYSMVAGDSGVIIKTVNGGTNWELSVTGITGNCGVLCAQASSVYEQLSAVYMLVPPLSDS